MSRPEPDAPGSEGRYRAIVEAQAELISLARPDGTLLYVNPAYARHFGHVPGELVGKNLFDFVVEADRPAVRAVIADVLSSGRPRSTENRVASAAGDERWVAWTNGLQHEDGDVLLHSVGRDVTDRKRVDAALRESRAFLGRMGRVAGVGGWQLDLRSGVVVWNDETRRIHDVGPGYEPTLAAANEFYAAPARDAVAAALREGMETGKPWDLEVPFVTAAGRGLWVRTQGEVERENGVAVRLVGAIQDISERKALEHEIAEREAFVRKITDSLPVRIAYVDGDRRYRFVNLAHCRRFGRSREEILGRTRDELLGGAGPTSVDGRIQAVLAGEAQRFEYEDSVDGVAHRFDIQLMPDLAEDGHVRGYFYTGLEVTERSRAEEALRDLTLEAQRQSDVLRLVTEAIPSTVVVVGIDTRYRFANRAFEQYCGLPREQIIGRTAIEVLGADEVARRRPFMMRALAGESVIFTLDYPGPDGATWLELNCIPLRLSGGAVDGFVGISQDITAQRREQTRLTELSQRDPLTELLNRAGFEQALERRIQAGDGAALGLLYIDLDRFKPVNDRHGHAVGDRLLRMVAQRLGGLVRPTDAVARLGGDEFAILLVDVGTMVNARVVADKVVGAIGEPFDVDGRALQIGASVGVAFGIPATGNGRELVERADAKLYDAKAAGRGRHAS
jgi:diguanylate cyclase (GGDEF)-like protein/PAS domain S-box-containing protein